MVLHNTASKALITCNVVPEDTSHNCMVASIDADIIFLPSPIIHAEVTERVCPHRTCTGWILVPPAAAADDDEISGQEEEELGNSAERIEKLKSVLQESKMWEEGKNWRELMVDRCGFETSLQLLVVAVRWWMMRAVELAVGVLLPVVSVTVVVVGVEG